MRCPNCNSMDSKVVDKRDEIDCNKRRRECLKCKTRFTTYERIELKQLSIKKSRKRGMEPFNRNKLKKGIMLACEKRQILEDKIDDIVKRIEETIRKYPKRNQTTKNIGKLVLQELKNLDAVAYLRFASVHQNFKNVKAFESEAKKLQQ